MVEYLPSQEEETGYNGFVYFLCCIRGEFFKVATNNKSLKSQKCTKVTKAHSKKKKFKILPRGK